MSVNYIYPKSGKIRSGDECKARVNSEGWLLITENAVGLSIKDFFKRYMFRREVKRLVNIKCTYHTGPCPFLLLSADPAKHCTCTQPQLKCQWCSVV